MINAEKIRYRKLTELGCIVCNLAGYGYTPPEIHHIRHGVGMGQRNSYDKAIPLCHAHHRTGGYGVAIHAGQVMFESNYGTEEFLLDQTNERL